MSASAATPNFGRGLIDTYDGKLYLYQDGHSRFIGDVYPSPCRANSPPHHGPCVAGWPTWDRRGLSYAYTISGYGTSNPVFDTRVVVVSPNDAEGSWPFEIDGNRLFPQALAFSPDGRWLAMSLLSVDPPYRASECSGEVEPPAPAEACYRGIYLLGWAAGEQLVGPIFRGAPGQEFLALDWRHNVISYVARQDPDLGVTYNVLGHFATNNRSGSVEPLPSGEIETAHFSPDGKKILLDEHIPGLLLGDRSLYTVNAHTGGDLHEVEPIPLLFPGDFAGSFGVISQPLYNGDLQFYKGHTTTGFSGNADLHGQPIDSLDWFMSSDVAACHCSVPLTLSGRNDPFEQPSG